MITRFIRGKHYMFTGDELKNRNPGGEMNFMVDGFPHKCNDVDPKNECKASFYDSPSPDHLWNWSENMNDFEEVDLS